MLENNLPVGAIELDSVRISGNDGMKIIIERLDKTYQKDKLVLNYKASEKFEMNRFRKNRIKDFLTEFDKMLHKTPNCHLLDCGASNTVNGEKMANGAHRFLKRKGQRKSQIL